MPQSPGGRRNLGPERPAAPRGRGRHCSARPLHRHPDPFGLCPLRPEKPAGSRLSGPGLRRGPLAFPGPVSPPPRPTPQPDSPREYRDLGDSRSRSALSNEMKSEGIAARPSPARGQREGGGAAVAAAPPLRDRGHRTGGDEARAAAAASSSRVVTSTGPRTEETMARWRVNSTGTDSRWPGEGSGRGRGRERAKGSVSCFSSAKTDGRRHRRRR